MSGARILVVEDDASIRMGLEMALARQGFEVTSAADGREGLRLARSGGFDLIVLDIMLPGLNGHELLGRLRGAGDDTPVLILSARGAEMDRILGLDLGADDYVTKPFSVGELLARVRALLRRRAPAARGTIRFGEVALDLDRMEVRRGGQRVELTRTELEVLAALARARGRVLSREQILDAVWGPGHHGTPRTVDNFVAQLRAKLEADPAHPRHILTVRGFGYRLDGIES